MKSKEPQKLNLKRYGCSNKSFPTPQESISAVAYDEVLLLVEVRLEEITGKGCTAV